MISEEEQQRNAFINNHLNFIREYEYETNRLISQAESMKLLLKDAKEKFDLNIIQIAMQEEEEEERPCDLYYILNEDKSLVKIGISYDAKARCKNMQTGTGYILNLIHSIRFDTREQAFESEQMLHREFANVRKKVKITSSCEWFDANIVSVLMDKYDTKEKIIKQLEIYNKHYMKSMQNYSAFMGDMARGENK